MSYCRFSSDDFKCDVYVYSDVSGGYTIHVAGNKILGDIPHVPRPGDPSWKESLHKQRRFLNKAKHAPIGLSRDGTSYWSIELDECIETLKSLKEEGYNVPDYAIEALEEEANEA